MAAIEIKGIKIWFKLDSGISKPDYSDTTLHVRTELLLLIK